MSAYVLTCDEANYDAVAQTCSAPYYAPQQELLPPLTVGDGFTISAAILAVWAVGFGIKAIRRTLSHT